MKRAWACTILFLVAVFTSSFFGCTNGAAGPTNTAAPIAPYKINKRLNAFLTREGMRTGISTSAAISNYHLTWHSPPGTPDNATWRNYGTLNNWDMPVREGFDQVRTINGVVAELSKCIAVARPGEQFDANAIIAAFARKYGTDPYNVNNHFFYNGRYIDFSIFSHFASYPSPQSIVVQITDKTDEVFAEQNREKQTEEGTRRAINRF